MQARLKAFWDSQHVHPHGIAGHIVGERMVRQHHIETVWTLGLLDVQPDDHVLEIGFGAGKGLANAARRAHDGYVAGIDVSRTMLAHARRRNRIPLRQGRMALVQGDVTHLPFGEVQFDKVFSIHTYYFWPDTLDITAQLFRLLRPHGMFAVTLATGIVAPNGDVDYAAFGGIQEGVERVVAAMKEQGYTEARLERGPNNRQYNNVALIGVK